MLSTLNIPGYKITEIVHEGLNTVVYRGISELKQERVILKVLKAEYPTLEEISRLKHEYSITSNVYFDDVDLNGVVKVLRLETHQNRLILVSQDFGGVSLKEFLVAKEEQISLISFLSIGVQVVQGLVFLHTHNIIHKDIKPSNIVINPDTGECKIIDFSIASNLSQETTQLISPYELEGSLAYMSPEQTGRINRVVDYRSDFYSLGVTFYEILTGQLPFENLNPVELVYCHLAKEATPVTLLNPDVPEIINLIVAKLMAKNAEDRYQTASGLLVDLQRCLNEVKTTGTIEYFDISSSSDDKYNKTNTITIDKTLRSSTHKSEILDLATVIKASAAINSEINLENLPLTLLHIILENAGAQKGCLILEKDNQFFVEAIENSDSNNHLDYLNRPSILVDKYLDIPQTVINYVIHTKEILVLVNATVDPLTNNCPYVKQHQCKSILCVPIITQGQLIGLFYLENNLATGIFTSNRLELMKILASQGAIAINNARLFAREQKKSQQLQQLLQQQQQSQLELAQQEEQYRSIFESVNDGMAIHSLETGNMIEVNPKICQMYGYSKEEYLRLTPPDFLHPDYLYLFSNFIETIKAGKQFYCQAIAIRKDGCLFNIEAKATSCMYNGQLHALVIIRDISDRITAETEIKQKSADLEQALINLQNTQSQLIQTEKISALGQLVAGVAHEVNNPVSFINGNLAHAKNYIQDLTNHLNLYQKYYPNPLEEIQENAEEIELEYLLEDLPQMISSMKIGTERIRDIMQSLRNYSRKDGVEKQPADIHKGIDSTLIVLSHRLKATPENPAIKVIKEYGNLPEIPCFSGQLNQVFMNLIANAIDAIQESNFGKTIMEIQQNPNIITIKTSMENNYGVIRIADNGIGMTPTVKQKLFTNFFTTKAEGKGTGLGLSISKEIVENKHGGKLSVDSEIGKGTEFIIQIPTS